MSRRTLIAGAALALAVGACSKGTPETQPTSPTPTSSASATPSPSPTKKVKPPTLLVYTAGAAAGQEGFGEDFDVFLFDAKTNNRRRLTTDGDDVYEGDPHFRNRREITWVENEDGNKATLRSYDLRNGRPQRVFRITGSISAHDWDPKGRRIAYIEDNRGRPRVFVWQNGSRKKIRDLPRFDGRDGVEQDEVAVTWSPDGSRILAVDTRSDNSKTTLFVLEPDGSDAVGPKFGTFGRWSPDSARVTYRNWETPGTWYRLDVRSDSRKRLEIGEDVYRPALSPDGRTLAYDDGRERPGVYLFDLETGEERRLSGVRGVGPIWLSSRDLVVTDADACDEAHEDPDACALGPRWSALRTTTKVRASTGKTQEVSAHTTLDVDVRLG